MNFSTWTIRTALRATSAGRLPYLAGLSLLAASLTGCPLDEPTGGPPDGGSACTEEYFPVCGEDGVTYGNGCLAEQAGVRVASTGSCDENLVPCDDSSACAEGEYCDFSDVNFPADEAPRPFEPIDGGVSLLPPIGQGVCRPIEVRCGGQYGDTCGEGEYCDVAVGLDAPEADPAPRPAYDGGAGAPPPFDAGVMPPPFEPTGVCRPLPEQGCSSNSDCAEGEYCDAAVGLIADPALPGPSYDGGMAPPYVPTGVCRPLEGECGGPNGVQCEEGYHCETGGVMADLIPLPWDGGMQEPIDAGAPLPWDGGAPPPYGQCVPDEEPGCPNTTELVCGSNGITYQNACVAESMGATIVSQGRCPRPTDRACGGWSGNTCTASEYCYFEPATWCDYADASGVCRPRPEACTREYSPVCGCNGETYSNACVAASQGTSVASYGGCDSEPDPGSEGSTCGGLIGASCDMGLFCDFPEEALCGAADQTGTCTVMPDACPDVWLPVCGCDGDIYGNSCEAQAAGVSIAPMSSCLNR